ncbi:unnamed protein product [Ceutorhynchus assimilis]|uniref:Ubiquitin carboxyl-terminal hydrolase n=1 Tax=Ceutorhynchus assimilis TaxID=467358 RepID=A0A9N9MYK0_9CUCU|nr:unnamed protein product [Ceutorhynchus assimilis]
METRHNLTFLDNDEDTSDTSVVTEGCTHINKAVDILRVKKVIAKSGFLTDCLDCKLFPEDLPSCLTDLDLQTRLNLSFDDSLWLCLKCGHQACGRDKAAHALKHYSTVRSECHSMCVNTEDWRIWCYDCDDEIGNFSPNGIYRKKLDDAIEDIKKLNRYKKKTTLPTISTASGALPKKVVATTTIGQPIRVRGLSNLGNTCFFNSVMQCLGQTPYLVKLLDETSSPGQFFHLPGGQLKLKDKTEINLNPLEGEAEKWRPLAQTLAETLHELQSDRAGVYNPRNLLDKLCGRMPQFAGGDQHDSHELLRHLLEAVREEDQKRFKLVILKQLGFSQKTDPATVDEEKKQIIKFYGQQVSEMLLATEQVFRGALISTLQCQVCDHLSHRVEKFLDLSLPITEKQMPPVLRRKAEDSEDHKPSKHQLKKEKRAERNKKRQNRKNNANSSNVAETKSDSEESLNQSPNADADVEDNDEDGPSKTIIALPAPGEDFQIESGYNSEKIENSSPDSNRINSPVEAMIEDSGVATCSNIPMSPSNSEASSEANVDMGSPNSPEHEDFGVCQRPMSRLAFVENNNNKNNDLKEVDLEKLSLLNDGDSKKVHSIYEQETLMEESACANDTSTSEIMMDQDEDDEEVYSGTLAEKYQCQDGECSVQSCLSQFTECELLMGSNKVGCDLCTKRAGNKKTVYTDASKQLLIYNPPAVLILHFKRFQVFRFRSAKVSKFVKFSTILDLAPFCSKRSQNLPSVQNGQTKVLYSLYGVVEHSGSMHGGHYVAYIKVRAPLEENDPRWQFLPKNQKDKIESLGTEPQAPSGKWYYVSDSYVSESTETKVLAAQAYLLFYERLL